MRLCESKPIDEGTLFGAIRTFQPNLEEQELLQKLSSQLRYLKFYLRKVVPIVGLASWFAWSFRKDLIINIASSHYHVLAAYVPLLLLIKFTHKLYTKVLNKTISIPNASKNCLLLTILQICTGSLLHTVIIRISTPNFLHGETIGNVIAFIFFEDITLLRTWKQSIIHQGAVLFIFTIMGRAIRSGDSEDIKQLVEEVAKLLLCFIPLNCGIWTVEAEAQIIKGLRKK